MQLSYYWQSESGQRGVWLEDTSRATYSEISLVCMDQQQNTFHSLKAFKAELAHIPSQLGQDQVRCSSNRIQSSPKRTRSYPFYRILRGRLLQLYSSKPFQWPWAYEREGICDLGKGSAALRQPGAWAEASFSPISCRASSSSIILT